MQLGRFTFQLSSIHLLASPTITRTLSTSSNKFWRVLLRKRMNNWVKLWRPIQTWLKVIFGRFLSLKIAWTRRLKIFSTSCWARNWSVLLSIGSRVPQTTTCTHMCILIRVQTSISLIETRSSYLESTSLRIFKVISMRCTSRTKKSESESQRSLLRCSSSKKWLMQRRKRKSHRQHQEQEIRSHQEEQTRSRMLKTLVLRVRIWPKDQHSTLLRKKNHNLKLTKERSTSQRYSALASN